MNTFKTSSDKKREYISFLFRKGFIIREENQDIIAPDRDLSDNEKYMCDFLNYNYGYSYN